MKHFATVTISVLLLFNGASSARAEMRAMYGAGTVSCAEWQKYRKTNNKPAEYQLQAWVDGYLSGYNVSSDGVDFLANKPSPIAFYAWLDNYCQAHPLEALVNAATELHKELLARAKSIPSPK